MTPINYITGEQLIDSVCKGIDIEPRLVQKIVIEASLDSVVIVYVQMLGTDKLLDVRFTDAAVRIIK